jgi:very-short-patch-repair endonuclease
METNILININGSNNNEKYVIKYDVSSYDKIIEFNLSFNNISWANKVFNYINKIIKLPKCSMCNNNVKFISYKNGYRKFCSTKCSNNSPITKKNKKLTSIANYGVEHPMQNSKYKENFNEKINKKFGVDNISKNNSIKEKKEKTLLKNYGVTHPLKSDIIKERAIQTNIEHWGVKNVSQSDIISERKKNTFLKNYNVEYGFQSEEIKDKITTTIQNKYNVDHYVQSEENKLCIKNSMDIKRKKFWSDYFKIDASDIIISGNTFIINNLCKIHNSFEINRFNLYNRTIVGSFENICTLCNPISEQSSIKENEVRNFIENELDIKTEKIRIDNKEIDIYIPDHKLGIEFDGLYWHSDNQKDSKYHLNKTELCEEQGIQLLHIFEDEWLYKKDIIKSIIKSKLNIIENKIFARKCIIREIDNKTCKEFLINNHIQGNINSKIKIGLFYNNELVSIMTFGKKRISMGNKIRTDGEYEMLRFCNKLNTQVIGGAGKLLNYFIKTYNPKSILTFADKRYSQGRLYINLGFEFVGDTQPNYFYFKPSEMIRYYRFKFRKDVLVKEGYDSSKTEFQIMNEREYLRIYDCGHMKFEKIL